MNTLINKAVTKPIVIKETELPSSVLVNSSETIQTQFNNELFLQTKDINQIEVVSWNFLADFNDQAIQEWVDFYQIYSPEFSHYIGTLGLLDTMGNPKPAYESYLNILDSFCIHTNISTHENTDSILVYPNPTNEYLNIQAKVDFHEIEASVHNLFGEKILLERNINELNISNLPAGTYLLIIEMDNLIETHKFIKLE